VQFAAPPPLYVPTGQGRGALAPAGQNEPAGHPVPTGDVAPSAQNVPAAHGLEVGVSLPVAVQYPAAHAAHAEDPPPEKKPAAQGVVVPEVWPAPQ